MTRLKLGASSLRPRNGLSDFDHPRVVNNLDGVFFERDSMDKTEALLLQSSRAREWRKRAKKARAKAARNW